MESCTLGALLTSRAMDQGLAEGLQAKGSTEQAQQVGKQSVHLTKNNLRQPLWLGNRMHEGEQQETAQKGATGQTRGVEAFIPAAFAEAQA